MTPELAEFPNLGAVARLLAHRPAFQVDEPLEIPDPLFDMATAEMAQAMKARGFTAIARDKGVERENFLLYGATVVRADG